MLRLSAVTHGEGTVHVVRRPPAPTAGTTLHAVLTGAACTLDISAASVQAEARKVRDCGHAGVDFTRWVTLVNRAVIGLCAAILVAVGILILLLATGREHASHLWQFVVLALLIAPTAANVYLTVARPRAAPTSSDDRRH